MRPEVNRRTNCGDIFEKLVSYGNRPSCIDEGIVGFLVDFECGHVLQPVASSKVIHNNRQLMKISMFLASSVCIPSNDKNNFFNEEQHASNIFVNPY